MKLAFYYNLAFGGAKRAVYEQVKGLVQKGHEVDVYTLDQNIDIFDMSKCASRVYVYKFKIGSSMPFLSRLKSDYDNFFTLKKLHKKIAINIDKNKYDLVIVHPDKLTQAPFVLRFLKTPSVYYCQEPLRICYEYALRLKEKVNFAKYIYEEITRFYRKKIDRENVRAATYTLASCYHIRERMIEAYDVFPKISYLGVDENVFKPLKIKKVNQVFFIGSKINSLDGFDLAENAIGLIPKNLRPILRVVSWKKENNERLTERKLVELYNQSIITLCMSRFETFGLVPLEAMSCGQPVIATKVSGHRETVIDGKTGYLVDFDPKEIAAKIIFIIENPLKASEMGKNARKHIEDSFNWEKIIDNFEDLLRGFVKKHKE